jgi:glycerol-3-phosphate dehydrogenase
MTGVGIVKSYYSVIIIGGGTTGTAIARDLALRGMPDVLLLEKRDLASETTGKCHSNLHSGMRYILNDIETAKECLQENEILKRIAPHTVDPAGSLWIAVEDEMVDYARRAKAVTDSIGLPLVEVDPEQAMREEPLISHRTLVAYRTPDAGFDPIRFS